MFYIHFILLLTTQVLILSCASVDESLLSDEREQVDKSGGETQQLLETLLRKTLAGESNKDSNGDDKDVLEVHVPINLLFVGSTQPNDASSLRHQTLMQTLEPWFKQVAHNLRHLGIDLLNNNITLFNMIDRKKSYLLFYLHLFFTVFDNFLYLVAPVGIEQTRTEYQETRESYIECLFIIIVCLVHYYYIIDFVVSFLKPNEKKKSKIMSPSASLNYPIKLLL